MPERLEPRTAVDHGAFVQILGDVAEEAVSIHRVKGWLIATSTMIVVGNAPRGSIRRRAAGSPTPA